MADSPRALPEHLQKLIELLPLNEPVHQSAIFAAYGKSNYARRIRKIVSEYGWEIERKRGTAGANDDYYIRRSEGPVRQQQHRYEVSPPLRRLVYLRDAWRCRICGVDVSEAQALTKAQCDHKVPAERGGDSKEPNLQTLCVTCNLKKRQACKGCRMPSCAPCSFAFPEQFEAVEVVRLTADEAAQLSAVATRMGVPRSEAIRAIVRAFTPRES